MKNTILFLFLFAFSCNTTSNSSKESSEPNKRLHDIWVVESINGQVLKRGMKRPRFEMNLTTMKFMGNDTCNEFFGTIKKATARQIAFGDVAGTKKRCPEMEIPNQFREAFDQTMTYELKELKLYFFDEKGKEILAFQKID